MGQYISTQSRASSARMKTKEWPVGREPAVVTAVGPGRLSTVEGNGSRGCTDNTGVTKSFLLSCNWRYNRKSLFPVLCPPTQLPNERVFHPKVNTLG